MIFIYDIRYKKNLQMESPAFKWNLQIDEYIIFNVWTRNLSLTFKKSLRDCANFSSDVC